MQVSLEQDNKVDSIRDSLAMNITVLSNSLASQTLPNGTAILSGVNVFESCATSIESNCTIQPPTRPGVSPTPCATPEILLNQVRLETIANSI